MSKYTNKHKPCGLYEKYFKRAFDVTLSTGALVVLSPVMGITALLVRNKLGSPVIYTQERPGLNEKIFRLYKFRTMTDARDENGELLPDEDRLTDFGKLLRSTSLDELPELINIIKGDMSIVGPRPLMSEYLPYYTSKERHRHDVRPGLTGLAQICGRSFISWEDVFNYDLQYVNSITFKRDANIIIKTIKNVIEKKDIADVSAARKDEKGRYYCSVDGEEIILHSPLNEERKKAYA